VMNEEPVAWENAKASQPYFDLRTADSGDFTAFVFDHEVAANHDALWYFDSNLWIDYDTRRTALLFAELFAQSGALPSRYSKAQLEQGCWAMISSSLECSVHGLIWRNGLDIERKEALIGSIFQLYANLFMNTALDTACEMFWDALAYEFNPMKRAAPDTNEEHRRIQLAMFSTLVRILGLDSRACQNAALHGLNHVMHPNTGAVVAQYLASHPELTPEERDYADACARGKVM